MENTSNQIHFLKVIELHMKFVIELHMKFDLLSFK